MHFDGQASSPAEGLVHRGLIYGSDQEFIDAALPFLEAGMASGEPGLVTVNRRHVENLRDAMGGVPDGLTLHPVEDWYETSVRSRQKFGQWATEHSEASVGTTGAAGRVRLIGEPPWTVGDDARVRDWARYESVWNVACAGLPATVMCAHDAGVLPEEVLAHARSTHPEMADPDGVSHNDAYQDPIDYCRRLDAAVAPQSGVPSMAASFALDDLPALRQAIGSVARDAGMDSAHAEDLVVAVNEIATNAVVHGRTPATLRLWRKDDEIVVEVADAGEGIQDVLAGQRTPPLGGLEGRGLWLARLLCDVVEVRNEGGCTVSMHAATPSRALCATSA